MAWSFVLTDMRGTRIGEFLNATERKYVANLSKPSTATLQIRKDNPFVQQLFSDSEDYLLQVWDDSTLRMWGPILTANIAMTDGQPPSCVVTAADPAWRLKDRFYFGTSVGLALTGDKGTMVGSILEYQNKRASLGLTFGSDISGSTGTYTAGPYKEALACIQELGAGFDGFDWYVEPLKEPTHEGAYPGVNGYLPQIGKLRLSAVVGGERPAAAFEYGVGRESMRAMNFLKDQTTRANLLLNVSEEGLEPTVLNTSPLVNASAAATELERWGIYEDMAELSGVTDVTLRTQYVEEALRVRQFPRRVLSMTSDIDDGTGRVPKFGTDYWLGDTVPAKSYLEGVKIFSGNTRVYSVEVALNSAGTATVTPILVEEAE